MTAKELQDSIAKLKLDLGFKVKVLITNELGYIIIIKTNSEIYLTIQKVSEMKNTIMDSIRLASPEYTDYIHMILINPKEWPFGIGKIQQKYQEKDSESEMIEQIADELITPAIPIVVKPKRKYTRRKDVAQQP